MPDARFEIQPYDFAAAHTLATELGVSHVLAQILARRGLTDPQAAQAFLDADVRHPLDAFGGLREAAAIIFDHIRRGSRITIHGDYDVDGVSSTAILVRAIRTLGGQVNWYLPSRTEDGYGLALPTVEKLAARGTQLLITADCAITAVDEVAAARAAGIEVVVTDHHAPRADGVVPDAPIVHPRLGGNPCPDLCAAGVAHKLAGALLEAAGHPAIHADEDLDLVALATVADVVPLHDENRALVRAGLKRLAATRKPGLRALMAVAQLDPSAVDATSIGFRLAPRINAAGRIARADAGLELLLTGDEARAQAVAEELDGLNHERRDVETRMRFEAEALVREQRDAPAFVLAAEGWHPGVIGIVAARIAERYYRPTVLIALDGEEGTGSGRSIPAFDLLGGFNAAARHLLRHGGHRAAAGLTIRRDDVDAFRESFAAHAADVLTPADLVPAERVDAVVPGDALDMDLAEELRRLEPFGQANPAVKLLVPGATLSDPKPLSEGRHVACALHAGGAKSRAVRFGEGDALPAHPIDASVSLEVNTFNGTQEPRLVLRRSRPSGGTVDILGQADCFADGVLIELDAPLDAWGTGETGERETRDVRGRGVAGTLADLVATGEPVLVVCAHAAQRAQTLAETGGGLAVADWDAAPAVAEAFPHVVALDPPAHSQVDHLPGRGWTHLLWGDPELRFAYAIHEWEYDLREPLGAVYRALRQTPGESEQVLRGDGSQPRTPALAGRLLRILAELELVAVDRDGLRLELPSAPARTSLERSTAFVAYGQRLEDGRRFLTTGTALAA